MSVSSIHDAKVLISSARVSDRTAGLKELIHILRHNRGESTLDVLTNKSYLALCETLFQCLRDERTSLLRTKARTARTSTSSLSASALRHVVSTGVRTFKTSTAENIIHTIIEVSWAKDGTLIRVLLEDLPKALRGVLEYQPHVERLSERTWVDAVDFCLEALSSFLVDPETDAPDSLSTASPRSRGRTGTPFDPTEAPTPTASSRDAPAGKSILETFLQPAEDFVHCLQLLTKAPNAPILRKADGILSTLIHFLQRKTARSRSAALAAVNSVLARTSLHSTLLTKRTIQDMLPLMKPMWSDPGLRDELLIFLINSEAHVLSLLSDEHEDAVSFDLEALVETMYGEYRRRQESTLSQFLEEDHLCFRRGGKMRGSTHPLNTAAFSMEAQQAQQTGSESLWALVSAIARFSYMLDNWKRKRSHDREIRDELPAKRMRTTQHFTEYLRHVSEPKSNAKRAALHVLAFMTQEGPVEDDDLQSMLEKLTVYISDENPVFSSWASIALTAAAFQPSSSQPGLLPLWLSAWHSACRTLTSVSSSRAACHLLNTLLGLKIVPFSAISNTVQSILASIELSGPALLTEASSALLTTLVQQRMIENPTNYNYTVERVTNWLLSKWTPALWSDRNYSSLNARHCNARDVVALLHACLDRPFTLLEPSPYYVLGHIAHATVQASRSYQLTRYILLLPKEKDMNLIGLNPERSSAAAEHLPTQQEMKLLDFCLSELEKIRQTWQECTQKTPTPDMLRILTNFCIVASALSAFGAVHSKRSQMLETSVDTLIISLSNFLVREKDDYKVDAVIDTCSAQLPDVRQLKTLSPLPFRESGILLLATRFSKALASRKDWKNSLHNDDDIKNVDDGVPRHEIQAGSSLAALRANIAAYLHFISCVAEHSDEDGQIEHIPSEFVDRIISIHEDDLLCSTQFVSALLSTRFRLERMSYIRLLERLTESLLDPAAREYNTSEVANGIIVLVLTGTIPTLDPGATDREGQDLYDIVESLHAYYAKEMEKGGVRRSPNLQVLLADFLHGLLKHHPTFGENRKSPSVRTSLFELLTQGEIALKYHIAEILPSIFDYFILPEHDKILEDIDHSLPSEREWVEGIAIRLLVLANLASAWHTLLRQGVYQIFATAGSIESAIPHAMRCIETVAQARNLSGPPALFRLFAPQIIFTWLDRKRLFCDIPFPAFGYPSLQALIRDTESEAVAQAIMLGLKSEVEYLAQLLGTSTLEALDRNIAKSAAYAISWDTCKGFARNKSHMSNEKLLREMVGSDRYSTLLQMHFPRVLGYIMQTIEQEDRISKALERRPAYADTAKALKEMADISHSEQNFDLGLEPSFNAYYVFDQLERLCRRIGETDPINFWKPEIYTCVMRMLLDRLHSALGSLHARSIIRKIRILVALAGNVAYRGYPLQMTLQSLRPFLTDIQCAEDTLGIVQYLFAHGKDDLRAHFGFVTGMGLSILISIRVFLGSSQDSTTQESHHKATMNKANHFHTWLTKYLDTYADMFIGVESPASVKAFKQIINSASHVRVEGNSFKGSEESRLLLQILDDVRSGRGLLSKASREVALDLLCQDFQPALSARDDVLDSDPVTADYAPQIWESCQRDNIGNGYKLWAAKVLGRAFSAYGEVKRKADTSLPWSSVSLSPRTPLGRTSREAIIEKIAELFYSDDRKEVGLAESAIRSLISRNTKKDYIYELDDKVPTAIGEALMVPILPEPETETRKVGEGLKQSAFPPQEEKPVALWIRDLAVALCDGAPQDRILSCLPKLLLGIDEMAALLFPYIVHLVLLDEPGADRRVRQSLSEITMSWFRNCNSKTAPFVRILIQTLLYLRSQPVPKEVTRVDRDDWLEIDFLQAAIAAAACGMYRSAVLFAETSTSKMPFKSTSRRASKLAQPPLIPVDLQIEIYKNLDEPDSFYGVDRGHSLASVLDRLDHEADGVKGLLFRGARLDSQIRRSNTTDPSDSRGIVKSLINLNMNSITNNLLSNEPFHDIGDDVIDSTLHTARKLGKWDIKPPEGKHSEASTLFKAFQGLHYAPDVRSAKSHLDRQLLATMDCLSNRDKSSSATKSHLRALAVLAEADEFISTPDPRQLLDVWDQMKSREKWMRAGEFEDVRLILSCRETLFNVIGSNAALQESLRAQTGTVRHMEAEALIQSSVISRKHGALQDSLSTVTYLSDIVQECKSIGLDIEAMAQHEVASVLWDQGETETSIRMRQQLIHYAKFDSQGGDISLPVLLSKLGHHLAEARLEKPDTIIKEYLEPAIRELKGQIHGAVPGQVFHEFAFFCDKQLQNPEAAEDLARIKTVMDRKAQECEEFRKLAAAEKSSKSMKETYKRNAQRAATWYKLDKAEYDRLRKGREIFLQQCLENYLLSLQATDEYNNDALRVFSLWLEYSETQLANNAVKSHLSKVPSGKFALLMNQLSSRLQAESTEFQKLLSELVYRICVDHPYHGMYNIFAIQTKVSSGSKEDVVRSKDESAKSRQRAANTIAAMFTNDKRARPYWTTISQSAELYHALAMFKNEADNRQGREIALDKYAESKAIVNRIPAMKVPPATLQVEVRASCDYSDLPKITSFRPKMSIANGLSAPKIITAIASDGKPYKQLFKSGNDDLRQDAIMEQVFDQVSRLLKNHTATRLRNLGIRTYKVLPLSTRSGLMEFVQNTIPLHQYVMPAHEKYFPNDWKSDKCRKDMAMCQSDSVSTRVKIWQKIADNFHPVLRFFFLERFEDPDEWFEKRLNYTRSTAAISILGHVLGLGDRHCHNILLDEKSGEVVHIDLGVSFEAGRVLPVPEVVPFRLTRDLVDAMGYTKTEGVFRRCCEFTMDTLREERESIMTLLNVLRYDPLVNWSVTPEKAKRMQEAQDTANASRAGTVGPPGATPAPGATPVPSAVNVSGVLDDGVLVHDSHRKREEQQAGEAGRALSVVEKKLSKTLSTPATVNELIQTATDERNLAVLYCGWASYA